MTDTPSSGTDNAAPDKEVAAVDAETNEALVASKEDFVKRLNFLIDYIALWTGHPERRPHDTPIAQLREEWRHEGVVVRALVHSLANSGRSFIEVVERQIRQAP